MAGVKIRNLSDEFSWGSIVEGATHANLADEGVRAEIKAVFEDRGFLVFSGVEPSAKMHVSISQVIGPFKDHPTKTTPRVDDPDSAPGVIDMHYLALPEEDDTGKVMLNGKKTVAYSPWHFDHCYNNELNRAGVLRAPITPPEGGRTGFCDGIELYKQFSPELRQKLENLNIIYTLDVRLSQLKFGKPPGFSAFREMEAVQKSARESAVFPRAMHPAIWTRHTGEKVLHLGGWMAVGVEHHENAEGDAILEAACQEIRLKAHAYWHNWKQTDMLVWDNWRMLHAVEGNDPKYERRTQRTTIKGDYGLGYFEGGKKIGEVRREVAP
jgi:taurine dioxygenase